MSKDYKYIERHEFIFVFRWNDTDSTAERYSLFVTPHEFQDCKSIRKNNNSPFVVIFLFVTSGNYLGLGTVVNSNTVLTAEKIFSPPFSNYENILVLGGTTCPHWSANTQVRKIDHVLLHEYRVALVKLIDEWKFDPYLRPAVLGDKTTTRHTPIYGKETAIFGIHLNKTYTFGQPLPKKSVYHSAVCEAVHSNWAKCRKLYSKETPGFNKLMYFCIHPNDSYCHGTLGSPVAGVNAKGEIHAVGVVVDTNCDDFDLVVKTAYFDDWIKKRTNKDKNVDDFYFAM